jgi:hypothetical protein
LPRRSLAIHLRWCCDHCKQIPIPCLTIANGYFHQKLLMSVLLLKVPLYSDIKGRMAVYWLSNIGVRRNSHTLYETA